MEGYPNLRKITNLIKEDEDNKFRSTHSGNFPIYQQSPGNFSNFKEATFSSPFLFSSGNLPPAASPSQY